MPIRLKVLFSLAATVVLLVSVMYIVTKGMFEPRFAALEQARLPRLTREVQDQIEERCRQLGMQLRDWSHWTDAQRFIAGQMPDFAKRNFSPTTLGEMHLSAVAYVNRDGDPKLTLAADENGEPCTIDSVLLNELRPKGRLSHARTQKTLGLIREGANLYEFAAGPILPTDGNGESSGTCLFARKISDREIARIQATCEQRVEILHLAGEKERSILDQCLSQPNRIFSKPESDEWLSAYLPLVDFAGVPVALAHTTMTRDAYVQGQRAVSTFAIELAWTGLLLGGLTFWLFETLVLSRVSKFSRQLNQLANTGDLSRRITLGGSDEMARLARPVNELLESLESTKKALLCEQQRLIINEQRLSMALNATGDGYWDWSRETGLYISPGWSQLLGLQPNGGIFDPQQVFARMDEQDRERFRSVTTPVTRGETDVLTVSVRLKNADGEMKWVEIRGQVVARDEHGHPVRIV
ncbi:MAG: CHASE4 domain-containing protein, partial [Tepidisphaeraceae bacterium]